VAGPSLVVRVLGDVTGLAKSFQNAASVGSGAAKSMQSAFRGVLSTLNSTGVLGPFGEALAGVDQAIGNIIEHGKKIGPAMTGAGAAIAGVGVGLAAIGSKDQAAHQQLQAAVEATGKSYEDYAKGVEDAIKHQEKFGHTANETQDALRVLTQATGDPAKALQLLNTTSDLAAAKHIGLSDAATKLGKVYNGNAKLLKEFGITVQKTVDPTKAVAAATKGAEASDKALAAAKQHLAVIEATDAGKKKLTAAEAVRLKIAQDKVKEAAQNAITAHKKLADAQDAAKKATKDHGGAVAELATKLHGQASAAADTFGGHLEAIKAHIEDSAAAFGQKYGPAITAAGAGMSVLGGTISAAQGVMKTFKGAQEGVTAATEAMTVAEDAAAVSEGLALWPILLIIAAVGALIAVGYVVYRNWNTIWAGIKKIIQVVWDWIKNNWPLLLGILIGPFGLAVGLIIKYWHQIWSFLSGIPAAIARLAASMWHWVWDEFNKVLGVLKGIWAGIWGWLITIPAAVGRMAAGMWHGVTDEFNKILGSLQHIWTGIWSWFTGLPGKIAAGASGMFNGIANAFIDAMNAIIWVWNRLHFSTPSFQLPFPPHTKFPSVTIGVPQLNTIPHLAQGGLITANGLIYAHAGEVVAPIDKVPRGPAVVINDAHFSSELDVDALMRKAAWYVQTARI